MPEISLKLRPTVDVEATPTLLEAGIAACQFIRFKAKLPEKLGGWTRYYPFAFSDVIRDMHAWQDLNTVKRLSVGTPSQLAIITNGTLSDITPQTLVSDFSPDFTTTLGETTVEITDPNVSNVTTLDSVFFNTPISVGGIILSGLYPIASITGTHSYTIEAATEATSSVTSGGDVPQFVTTSGTSEVHVVLADHNVVVNNVVVFQIDTAVDGITVTEGAYNVIQVASSSQFSISANTQASSNDTVDMNGGNAQLVYYIALGPPATGVGYGIGGYGLGGYGTGVVPSAQTGDPITTTSWTTDNWGAILLACPRGGGVYYWDPRGGFVNASIVSGGPVFNGGLFVAMPEQILVTWGSSINQAIGVQQDPLLLRWSDILNFFEWSVTSETQAGSFRIPTGSKIMGGLQGPQQALIWTDIDLWAMQYLGAPLVWGLNKISSGCGLIGSHAATTLKGAVYWMSSGNFFVLSGDGVQEIPCPVWDVVFQDLDTDNQEKCVAAANSSFDEVTFYYPSLSGGSGEIDSYVKYNNEERSWDYGKLSRTAWIDQSVLGQPIGASSQNLIFQHETSPDADGQPLSWYFETGWFALSEGRDIPFVDWFFPDMKWGTYAGAQDANVQVTIYATAYPNQAPLTFGPFTMNAAKEYVNCRLRGRQIKFRFSGNDLGTFARLGNMRFRMGKSGMR